MVQFDEIPRFAFSFPAAMSFRPKGGISSNYTTN